VLGRDAILAEIAGALHDIAGVEPKNVTLEKSLIDDFDLDSLTMIELIGAVESIFDVDIPDTAVGEFGTVGDVVTFIAVTR
jgi:acyl carrier protein